MLKIELLDHEFDRKRARDEVTPEEMKEKLKKIGVEAPTQYNEKPMYISSTGAILDEYVPPEGDGKVREDSLEEIEHVLVPGQHRLHSRGQAGGGQGEG